jgi:hypothetical protein
MKPLRVLAYVIFGSILVFGIIAALIVHFSGRDKTGAFLGWLGPFAALMPFFVTSVTGFTFLGLTQETAADYPMKGKRAAWYCVAAGLIAFGISLFPVMYTSKWQFVPAIASEIPFLIPGIGLLVFLCLTEKNRLKPWALQYAASFVAHPEINGSPEQWQNPAYGERFGLFSGAIWIFALGLFIALGFALGFKYSWLVFIFAIAVQLFVQALMCKQSADTKNSGNREM